MERLLINFVKLKKKPGISKLYADVDYSPHHHAYGKWQNITRRGHASELIQKVCYRILESSCEWLISIFSVYKMDQPSIIGNIIYNFPYKYICRMCNIHWCYFLLANNMFGKALFTQKLHDRPCINWGYCVCLLFGYLSR